MPFEGREKLTELFGLWPSFHDAEIVELHCWRGDVKPGGWDQSNVMPVLTLKIRILAATQSNAAKVGDVLATVRFSDVEDLSVSGFNHVNQIMDLSVRTEDRGTFLDGTPLPRALIVAFQGGFGMAASFRCGRVEIVEATPCQD